MANVTRVTVLFPAPQGVDEHRFVTESIRNLLAYGAPSKAVANINRPSLLQVFDLAPNGTPTWDDGVMLTVDLSLPHWHPGLRTLLEDLKLRFQQRFGKPVIWMTVHELDRITGHDGVI